MNFLNLKRKKRRYLKLNTTVIILGNDAAIMSTIHRGLVNLFVRETDMLALGSFFMTTILFC